MCAFEFTAHGEGPSRCPSLEINQLDRSECHVSVAPLSTQFDTLNSQDDPPCYKNLFNPFIFHLQPSSSALSRYYSNDDHRHLRTIMASEASSAANGNPSAVEKAGRKLPLPDGPANFESASYNDFFQGCLKKNLNTPHLLTPESVDECYARWLAKARLSELYAEASHCYPSISLELGLIKSRG